MVVFVNKTKHPLTRTVPFEELNEYSILASWLGPLELNTMEVITINSSDERFQQVLERHPDAIVGLGINAAEDVARAGFKCYSLPHPSRRNALIRNRRYLIRALKGCRDWLKRRV